MKTSKTFVIASLAIVLCGLVGCTTSTFEKVGQIIVGDRVYTSAFAEVNDPMAGYALSLYLFDGEPVGAPGQMVEAEKSCCSLFDPPGHHARYTGKLAGVRMIDANGQGGDGIVNNFFKGGFAGLMQGAGAAIGAPKISVKGGGGGKAISSSSSGSSSSSAASAAASAAAAGGH